MEIRIWELAQTYIALGGSIEIAIFTGEKDGISDVSYESTDI